MLLKLVVLLSEKEVGSVSSLLRRRLGGLEPHQLERRALLVSISLLFSSRVPTATLMCSPD